MATYKEIKGTQIEVVSSDPSNPVEGQVWYNSTDQAVKGQAATTVGAWATGGSLNTGRRRPGGTGASRSSALCFGGDSPGNTYYNNTEIYDGTSWTEVNNLNTARGYQPVGAGTVTSGLAAGGFAPPTTGVTESWNGSNWTEVNDLNTARYNAAGCGASNTSALVYTGNPGTINQTESWNGTNWTEVNDVNTARGELSGFGIQTSAIAAVGETPSGRVTLTELWNGTNWTEVNDANAQSSGRGAAGADNTAGLIFGGFESPPTDSRINKTEEWNGTNWTEVADLSGTTYHYQAGAGTSTSAISFGGEGPSNEQRTATEEWTGAGSLVTRTFTDS